MKRACVIGSGPNGIAAAIVLAQAGLRVDVFEAEAEPGGAARTLPLTLPGFLHDFGSAVHPFAAGSPFFVARRWRIMDWIGSMVKRRWRTRSTMALRWCSSATLAKPSARWARTEGLEAPGAARRRSLAGICGRQPGADAAHSASSVADGAIRADARSNLRKVLRRDDSRARARALSLQGLAGHSCLSFDRPLSATIGLMFGITIHAVGWPIPRGGARAITQALGGYLLIAGRHGAHLAAHRCGGLQRDGSRERADPLRHRAATIAGDCRRAAWQPGYRRSWSDSSTGRAHSRSTTRFPSRFPGARRSAGAQSPCTWAAHWRRLPRRKTRWRVGAEAERPFVLAAQPTLFDATRAPEGQACVVGVLPRAQRLGIRYDGAH